MKSVGRFCLFLFSMFFGRLKWKIYFQQWIQECMDIGVGSSMIVSFVSICIGSVTCIQLSKNMMSPLIPDYLVGTAVRNMVILELSPTLMALIFAGKVGSHIANQLGSMRITEQIDAIEVMGINPTTYVVLPKILASIFMFPLLVILSGFLAIASGYVVAKFLLLMQAEDYVEGIRYMFDPFFIRYAIYKSLAYAFLVSSIAAYQGFDVLGRGSMAVGKASTQAVTNSCIAILAADLVLTQLLL